MTTHQPEPEYIEADLFTVVEQTDQDPGTYVVISPEALATQLRVAFHECARRYRGEYREGRILYTLMRALVDLGFTVSTQYHRADEAKQ